MFKDNTPTLETERLILRKFQRSDLQDILILYGDEQVNKFLPWFPIRTIEQAETYLNDTILPQYGKEIAYTYAIELKESKHVIGYVHIHDIGGANDTGYAIAKEYWRMGIVSEACSAIVEHLRRISFPYITATHDINNPNSGEVMKKIGMTYRYTYEELWQPKNRMVKFRMYQLNLDGNVTREYTKYWEKYPKHYVEKI